MTVKPIPPVAMASVPGLNDPRNFYQVLQEPAPLAGMSFPNGHPWDSLASIGFQSVVCLTCNTPPYDPAPLEVLRSAGFKDLCGGGQPDDPKREADLLKEVVHVIVVELTAQRGVVVHCAGGTGRTGTVIACCFRALGMPTDDVLAYMTKVNNVRSKYTGWPESDWQRDQVINWTPT